MIVPESILPGRGGGGEEGGKGQNTIPSKFLICNSKTPEAIKPKSHDYENISLTPFRRGFLPTLKNWGGGISPLLT